MKNVLLKIKMLTEFTPISLGGSGRKQLFQRVHPFFYLLFAMTWSSISFAQEEVEKVTPRLRLSYTNNMDGTVELKALGNYRVEKQNVPAEGAKVSFFSEGNEDAPDGTLELDEYGVTVFVLKSDQVKNYEAEPNLYRFYARIEESDRYEEREADIEVWNAELKVNLLQRDSINMVVAEFWCADEETGEFALCERMPIKFYVKRALALLPIGADFIYTDENGIAEMEYPHDLLGDENGNYTVVVKLDDDDMYGTVKYEGVINWGVPPHSHNPIEKRTLIGARNNAPWFMIIGINALLLGIWGYIFYIVYGLFRIQKIGRQEEVKQKNTLAI